MTGMKFPMSAGKQNNTSKSVTAEQFGPSIGLTGSVKPGSRPIECDVIEKSSQGEATGDIK